MASEEERLSKRQATSKQPYWWANSSTACARNGMGWQACRQAKPTSKLPLLLLLFLSLNPILPQV